MVMVRVRTRTRVRVRARVRVRVRSGGDGAFLDPVTVRSYVPAVVREISL